VAQDGDGQAPGTVTALQRPPVRQSVLVRSDQRHTVDWGEVLVWEPPARFVMTWNMAAAVTEVELTFTVLGPALTRVAVEHRGWERLTEEELARDCALHGGYLGGAYRSGWTRILGRFAACIGEQS
jgi:uncharacterized protein YndB with AHSA1/START domain